MKKLTALVLSLILLTSVSMAEVDLSSYSYDQLLDLNRQVQFEIMSRPEWKEVTVPAGIYVIGQDIPEGAYTLTLAAEDVYGTVFLWGHEKDDYDTDGGCLFGEMIGGSQGSSVGRLYMKKGNVLELSCAMIVSPYKGLGF